MKNKVNAVPPSSVIALCLLVFASCWSVFAADQTEPRVQIGTVAQRYPWNGTLDVNYRANGLPATGTNAVVTVTANGKNYTQEVTLVNGQNTIAVTSLPANVKAKDAKVTLKLP